MPIFWEYVMKPRVFIVQEIVEVVVPGTVDYANIKLANGKVRYSLGTMVDADEAASLRNNAGRSALRVYQVKPGSTVYRKVKKPSSIKPQKPEKKPTINTGRRQARIAVRR